eukprot:UN07723
MRFLLCFQPFENDKTSLFFSYKVCQKNFVFVVTFKSWKIMKSLFFGFLKLPKNRYCIF